MATRLVILDCDGVLVDSEPISCGILADMATELGWPMDRAEAIARFKGKAQPRIWAAISEHLGRALPDDVEPRFRATQFARLRSECQVVPGAGELLDGLEGQGMPYCVASNGPHNKMRVTLGGAALLERFEGRIFSREDVQNPKPAPDLFLHAARALGAEPAETVVVEDSPLGVQAARAAGMRVLGFTGTAPEERTRLEQAGAEAILERLTHVLDRL